MPDSSAAVMVLFEPSSATSMPRMPISDTNVDREANPPNHSTTLPVMPAGAPYLLSHIHRVPIVFLPMGGGTLSVAV